MLQKSKSRTISKLKLLVIFPMMLTYAACSGDPLVPEHGETHYSETLSQQDQEIDDIPFAFIEKVPIYPGCEGLTSDEDRKRCMEEKIRELVSKKFVHGETRSIKTLVQRDQEIGDIPFAIVEEVPVFPGCENYSTNIGRKNCLREKVTDYVKMNFETSLGKELGLKGKISMDVQFRIKVDGTVEVIGGKAPHPALQEETERVVNLLPTMTPGKQKGQEVGVLYSLPIVLRVGE